MRKVLALGSICAVLILVFASLSPVVGYKNEETDSKFIEKGITIYVDDDNTEGPWDGTLEHPYQYIMDAVNHVHNNDTIFVFSGTYNQTLEIDFDNQINFNLTGENKENTHINGKIEFVWSKVSVKIEEFTIWKSIELNSWWTHDNIIKNNIIIGNLIIDDTKNNKVENNDFQYGHIRLTEAENCIILNNSFACGGIFFYRSSSTEYWNSHIIENNTINDTTPVTDRVSMGKKLDTIKIQKI